MIKKEYSKDETHAQQILSTRIDADAETVFYYLATTEGISNWFPQLAIDEEKDEKSVVFDLGDGTFEKMALLDYSTNEHIAFEWASGKIEFSLVAVEDSIELTLTEKLPLDFQGLPQDFTGWYVQMKNVKHVIETGKPARIEKEEILQIRKEVEAAI